MKSLQKKARSPSNRHNVRTRTPTLVQYSMSSSDILKPKKKKDSVR
jgi:hypothetical protein